MILVVMVMMMTMMMMRTTTMMARTCAKSRSWKQGASVCGWTC